MRSTAALLALGLLAAPCGAEPLTFLSGGEEFATLEHEEVVGRVPPSDVLIERISLGNDRRYRAFPLVDMLDAVYGELWRRAEMLLVQCADGYQPLIPVKVVLAHLGDSRGWLAFEEIGGDGLWEADEDGDETDYGPYRLFWKNRAGAVSSKLLEFPYMIVGFDLIRFEARFPGLAPPPGSSAKVVAGFDAFRQNCIKCHTINGQGASMPLGPELNYPSNVTEYWRPGWLRSFILDPRSIRHGAKMPGVKRLPKTYKLSGTQQEALVDDVISYLEAMRGRKLAPPR